jgi:hypothetical protein
VTTGFRRSGLTEDERIEYQEIGQFARHDDTIHLSVSSLTVPVLFAALGWGWQHPDLVTPLASGSLVLWIYWWVVRTRRNQFAAVRYARARELERRGGLNHHRQIEQTDAQQNRWARLVRIKLAEEFASLALFVAWIWLLLSHI